MYIKSQVSSGYDIQKVHGDDIFIRNDVMLASETCSDVAFRDIWGSGNKLGEDNGGCPLAMVTENRSHDGNADGTCDVVVVYYRNKHDMIAAIVCDMVVYILSDEGKTLDTHWA